MDVGTWFNGLVFLGIQDVGVVSSHIIVKKRISRGSTREKSFGAIPTL